ncbi:MAG: PQQ-binding-like beta-propeller repeat protein [Phycisphaerae bacterium]|nr:PQQ-binding-like beta-propeller repeat protein [Phycisphaerae bacterium]
MIARNDSWLRIVFLAAMAAAAGSASAAETLWSFDLDSGMCDASIAYADVASPPGPELVLTTTSGAVVVLDADGKRLYKLQLGGVYSVSPTAADLFPGPPLEVLVVNQAGRLLCLSEQKTLWEYKLPAQMTWNQTTIVAEDLDADGSVDVIVGDSSGHLVCLTPRGVERWTLKVPGGYHCPPAVADLADEPGREVVITSGAGKLLCLSAGGKTLWQAELGCDNISGPVVADLDADGKPEIVVGGTDDRLHCFSSDGKPRWAFQATAEIDSAFSCGDLDRDGRLETVFVDLRGKCYCLDAAGKQRWRYDVRNRCRRSPSLADFDGDGDVEILVAGYDNRMYLLSYDGQEEDVADMPGTTNGGATVIKSKGRLAAIIPFDSTKVICYTWLKKDAVTDPRVLWGAYRVTPSQRGSVLPETVAKDRPHLVRGATGDLLVGRNVFEIRIDNPKRERLSVRLALDKPLSGESKSETHEGEEASMTVALPYLVRGDSPETLVFSYEARKAGTDRPILSGRKSVYVEPFVRDVEAVVDRLDQLADIEATLRQEYGHRTDALSGGRLVLGQQLQAVATRVAHPSRLSGAERVSAANELRELAAKTIKPLALGHLLLQRLGGGKQAAFVVWPANPWSPLRPLVDRAVSGSTQDGPEETTLTLYKNERGSLALDVANLQDTPLDLRLVFPARMTGERAPAIQVDQVIAVPTEAECVSHDAVAALNPARVLHLAPGEVRQLWIDVDARSCNAGIFTAKLEMSSLTAQKVSETITITAKILDLDITAAPAPKFCNWAYVYSSCLKDYEAQARQDLIDHGTNVFVVTSHHMPKVTYDETGKLVSKPDFTRHDEFIRNHGKEAMFLFCPGPACTLSGPKGHGQDSEAFRKAFKAWIPQWVTHLREAGVGYDRFAFYPVDEPGLNPGLVEMYIKMAKLTREVDPKILMYTDPVGRATIEEIKRMAPYVDIWCPNGAGYLMKPGDPRLPIMHESGKQVWTYQCDGNAKHQSPLAYYRGLAWLAQANQLTGIGFWSYCTSQHDPWYPPKGGHDYLLVYPGEGVITSKRWEACRDGLEDLRAVWQLKTLADAARKANPQDERVRQADAVVAEATTELAAFARGQTVFIPPPASDGPSESWQGVLDTFDRQYRAYRRHRERIAQATLALHKASR